MRPGPRLRVIFRNNLVFFYGEELLAPCPNSKLEDRPLRAVRDFLFNIFAASLHISHTRIAVISPGCKNNGDELKERVAVGADRGDARACLCDIVSTYIQAAVAAVAAYRPTPLDSKPKYGYYAHPHFVLDL
ncbi:hypothetical protein B7P43_G15121 [Cryptotermes secundus]|uniref:Uncharacterized protein n=1 Tax=Cryptotermes secundus TaxID=105785 RepID=A0A2J7QEA9_9NEOP|nr:hypothetical protein B7P43_G15121 [Cryptotermes secundus]